MEKEMRKIIQERLTEIEKQEEIRVLWAVESGSRAWDFASVDSDYDVRFVYVRPMEYYLRLEQTSDVLEYPINDALDIVGWDIRKVLQLLQKSNPTVFEWFASPIIYRDEMNSDFQEELNSFFSPKRSMYHYLNMARKNRNQYLVGDAVKVKKYFYMLRPILACAWIEKHGTRPPMRFIDLLQEDLSEELCKVITELLEIKKDKPETKVITRILL